MSLEEELGLVELSSVEMVYENPTAWRLKRVSKKDQTPQLVEFVVSSDGMALEYVSKKLITNSLCKIAVQQNGLALEYVPADFITAELCDLAVSENGLALAYVPEELITMELAYKAVGFYYIYFREYDFDLTGHDEVIEKGRKRGVKLLQKYPVYFVPAAFMTKQLLLRAVKYSPNSLRDIPKKMMEKEIILAAVSTDGMALQYIPKNIVSKEICEAAILNNPLALEFVPQKKITEEMWRKCFEKNPLVIKCIPNDYLTDTLCDSAFRRNPYSFKYIPEKFKTLDMCLKAIQQENFDIFESQRQENTISFSNLPEEKRNDKIILDAILEKVQGGAGSILRWNEQVTDKNEATESAYNEIISPLQQEAVAYLEEKKAQFSAEQEVKSLAEFYLGIHELQVTDMASLEVSLESVPIGSLPVEYKSDERVIHDFTDKDVSARTLYYITDIHLEHQLKPVINKIEREITTNCEDDLQAIICSAVDNFLDGKIDELVSSATSTEDMLLIGGDVASDKKLVIAFFKKLSSVWRGEILYILGNHELWDVHSGVTENKCAVDDVVEGYRNRIENRDIPWDERLHRVRFLENDAYIEYKNERFAGQRIIKEKQILNASNEELAEVCSKASAIILGGIGFSGLNPHYNAELGLYRRIVPTLEYDKELSERFYKVYRKLNQCAGSKQVIVFTHTPVRDWLSESCNSNWVYINGHTHQNNLMKEKNGAVILADNQIGYEPQKWKLNAINVFGWYDPFEKYKDGIYEITSDQYRDFNVGRGINNDGCHHEGKIYALKRGGLYMFLIETSSSLCLLAGGQRKKLEYKDVNYYYERMSLYGQIVREAIKPYQQFLETISREVKSFGGTGNIHGCIVDISWFSHIYVNPFDGKVTVYWALDTVSRLPFDNIIMLLEEKEPQLLGKFVLEQEKNALPVIDNCMMNKGCKAKIAVVPRWVYGTEMYEPSRILKAVQYIWSQNVIRVWNEDIINKYAGGKPLEDKTHPLLSK